MSAEVSRSTPPPSKVEGVKQTSRALRGTLAEGVVSEAPGLADADKTLIKFHGSYQQEDRDARKARRAEGQGKAIQFMVRCKIPGGRVTADQYLAVDDLADRCANGTLRFTSRQGIQLHGVLKGNLKGTIRGINDCLLTTLGACGDVNRNVMACPAPLADGIRQEMQATAARLAAHFAPRTGAYHEIWLNGTESDHSVRVPLYDVPDDVEEPIYGKTYLPRKFKMGIALPEDNCVDIYAQDLGFLAIVENGRIAGWNVLVGGGMGMSHGNPNTFPYVAKAICYVSARDVLETAEGVVKLFRDHGNRSDRKRARIKYVVHDWGVEHFREVLSTYVDRPLMMPRPVEVTGVDLHHGWHAQGDGKWFYGLSVENGRVKDDDRCRLRTGLRELVARFKPEVRLTPNQDILLCGLSSAALPEIEQVLQTHGIARPETLSNARRYSLACPAIPTCGLAISEAERALPSILDRLESTLAELGLEREIFSVRMTGCPNGCARPYQSDIGIVGRSGERYMLFVGGHVHGHRLNFELRDLVHRDDVARVLRPILVKFRDERRDGESFGDFCQRIGQDALRVLVSPEYSI